MRGVIQRNKRETPRIKLEIEKLRVSLQNKKPETYARSVTFLSQIL
jgi:hypothetical protein